MAKDKKKKHESKLQAHRSTMGLARKAHFESGGDLASWRGRANVYVDRKKKHNKNACRKTTKTKWQGEY